MNTVPLRSDASVVDNASQAGTSWRLRLRLPRWPGFEPGQFVMLSAGARGAVERLDPLLPRPMAIYRERAATGGQHEIEILYKRVGRGTGLLSEARPGQRVRLVGPLGRGFAPPPAGERPILVGGGTGIASLYELAARAASRGPVVVLLGARSGAELMGQDDFAALGVDLRLMTEDGSQGGRGLVTQALETALAGTRGGVVYACGPTSMMRRAAQIAEAAGVACHVSLENPMACGFGVCLGCAAPLAAGGFALVCREGPVFDAGAVAWERMA